MYNIFLYSYYIALRISSLWNSKAKKWVQGRAETTNKLKSRDIQNCIWFHTASLGEFEQVSYLIQKIKTKHPNKKILVSFFSPSGYEIKKDFQYADTVVYLPYDFKSDIREFIDIIQPKAVFWVRYEFWLRTLSELKRQNIPTFLLNGVFYNDVPFIYKPILKKCLRCFQKIFVISEKSKINLSKLGIPSEVLSDSRYDRMNQTLNHEFNDSIINNFIADSSKIIVCGSIWKSDDIIISDTVLQREDITWLLFPHEVNTKRTQELKNTFPNAQLYSNFKAGIESNILIVDTIGILSKAYRYADASYVGGGFDKVVHSLLEPFAYSKPIIAGKNIGKSEEARELIGENMVHQIINNLEFKETIEKIFSTDNTKENRMRKEFFKSKLGSTDKIMAIVEKNIEL